MVGGCHSRDELLRTRVTNIATYAHEDKHKMSKSRSLALYGSEIVPIPVPLHPNETLEMFEARFAQWLFRERKQTLERLRTKANAERGYRFAFARAEARSFLLTKVKEEDDVKVKEELIVVQDESSDSSGTVEFVGVKRCREDGEYDVREDEYVCSSRRRLADDGVDNLQQDEGVASVDDRSGRQAAEADPRSMDEESVGVAQQELTQKELTQEEDQGEINENEVIQKEVTENEATQNEITQNEVAPSVTLASNAGVTYLTV